MRTRRGRATPVLCLALLWTGCAQIDARRSATESGRSSRAESPSPQTGPIVPASLQADAVSPAPPKAEPNAAATPAAPEWADSGPALTVESDRERLPREAVPWAETPLTLADLEQLALQWNPALQQSAWVVEKARGIQKQVGLYPNPQISYSGQEIGTDGTAGQQGGQLSQTIVTGDKLKLNRAVAAQDVQQLSWEYEAQRYRVLNAVRLSFFAVLGAQRRLEIARELERVAQSGVETAESLFEAKEAARPDVLQAEIQLNEVRIMLQTAEAEYEAAWQSLAALIGRPDVTQAALQGTLEGETARLEWEPLYQQILAASPELHAARARVERARIQIRRQETQPVPNLLTQVGVAHDNSSGDNIASAQIGLYLPIFNRNQGAIQAAFAEYQQALRNVERLQLSLRVRLAEALRADRTARVQVERYRGEILPRARETLDLIEQGYKLGEFDFLRVLTARRTYFDTNLAYVRALTDLRRAEVVISGLLLTDGLSDVPDIEAGLRGIDLRDQALGGE